MSMIIVCDVCRNPFPPDNAPNMFGLRVPAELMVEGAPLDLDVCSVDCMREAMSDLSGGEEEEPEPVSDPLIPQRGSVPLPPEFAAPVGEVIRRS